jgi:thiosulfate/3-mercaptopyruvate sulfurtransferase
MPYSTIVSAETLKQHIDDPDWIVFDCRFALNDTERGRRDYQRSHIPGAYYAHLDEDLSAPRRMDSGRHPLPDIEPFSDWLVQHGVGDNEQVVVYDDVGGSFAARLWWMLHWLGHEAVAVLDGGWQVWADAGYPVNQEASPSTRKVFTPRPDRSRWLDVNQVVAAMNTAAVLVIDARAAERYAGEVEPLDPVAGHIPGSNNLYHMMNLGEDRRFQSPATLRARFTALLQGYDANAVVHSCGSGVSACHNLLAMEIAGLSGSRLYPGSWSEWITDPQRPIAVGRE